MTFRLTHAVLAVATTLIVSGPVLANQPAPSNKTARFEISFMQSMIDHHTMAIEMAELCPDRAVHPELLSTCEQIIKTQSREIETIQHWLE